MKNTKVLVLSLLFVPIAVFGQTAQSLPSAGLTPESRWYFFDTFGEAIRSLFSFTAEGKARLQISFASERIAELRVILETKGVEAKGLAVAQSKLAKHVERAADIVEKKQKEGKDVNALAKSLNEKLSEGTATIENVFKEKKRALEAQAKQLKESIRVARQGGDTAQVTALEQQLAAVRAQKDAWEDKEDEQEEALEQEEEKLERVLEDKDEAQRAIQEAQLKKQEYVKEAQEQGLLLPTDAFKQFDQHLSQAQELFTKENYQGAEQQAKQAKKVLEQVDDELEEMEDAKEEAEEEMEDDDDNDTKTEETEREIQKEILERERELMKKQEESQRE